VNTARRYSPQDHRQPRQTLPRPLTDGQACAHVEAQADGVVVWSLDVRTAPDWFGGQRLGQVGVDQRGCVWGWRRRGDWGVDVIADQAGDVARVEAWVSSGIGQPSWEPERLIGQ